MIEAIERIEAELKRLAALCQEIEGMRYRARLEVAQVRPGQALDSQIREEVDRFIKAKGGAQMKLFGRVRTVEPAGDGVIVSAVVDVGRDAVAKLREAFGRVIGAPLSEMHNRGVSGRVLRVNGGADGRVVVKALVTDRVAAEKIRGRIYAGLSLDCGIADGEIAEISLVDRPFGKSGAQDRVLAKLYRKEIEVTPLESALRKFDHRGVPGQPVKLSADERAALLAQPAVAARMAELEHIELGQSDARSGHSLKRTRCF